MTVRYEPGMAAQIDKVAYHPPKPDQVERMERARAGITELMRAFDEMALNSRELSLAFTKLDEALFWFNSAVVRNEE